MKAALRAIPSDPGPEEERLAELQLEHRLSVALHELEQIEAQKRRKMTQLSALLRALATQRGVAFIRLETAKREFLER